MKKIIFATSNPHKIEEINFQLKGTQIQIISKADVGIHEEIPETGTSFEENAIQKVAYLFEKTGMDCFGEDSGLVVDALDGAPGIYSARYAGEHKSHDDNNDKLLKALKGQNNRNARFVSTIALRLGTELTIFRGTVEGLILHKRQGEGGFGYDSIFQPTGYDSSFAELGLAIKSKISHRAESVSEFIDYLKKSD